MKIRGSILTFCIVGILVIVLIIWFQEKRIAPSSVLSNPAQVSDTNQTINSPKKSAQDFNDNISKSTGEIAKVMGEYRQGLLNKAQGLSVLNDIPIMFYGRLQDQFGNGLADATVNFAVQVINGYESTTKRGDVVSDANGFFTISGYRGQNLAITPHKEGYALATTDTLFWYSHLEAHPFVSDQNNPTIIKMWKLQGAEPLMSVDQHYKIPYSSEPINFDLLTGKIVPVGGDIKLTVTRPQGILSGRNRLDWGVQVEAVDGGLIESSGQEAVVYAAPENGYERSKNFIFSTNAPNKWFGQFNEGFFLMSRNGQVYSKLGLSFRINSSPDELMLINFGGIANTNGSRNWEGDPNTMQTVGQ